MSYIQILLENPGLPVDVLSICQSTDKTQNNTNTEYNKMADEKLEKESLFTDTINTVINEGNQDDYINIKNRLIVIEKNLKDAEEQQDFETIDELLLEKEELVMYLKTSTNIFGKERTTGAQSERMRVRVKKAINRALVDIKKKNKGLFKHLNNSISTGSKIQYNPAEEIIWICNK